MADLSYDGLFFHQFIDPSLLTRSPPNDSFPNSLSDSSGNKTFSNEPNTFGSEDCEQPNYEADAHSTSIYGSSPIYAPTSPFGLPSPPHTTIIPSIHQSQTAFNRSQNDIGEAQIQSCSSTESISNRFKAEQEPINTSGIFSTVVWIFLRSEANS
jgi:hypothetical protein